MTEILKGYKPCPLCGKILKWLPIRKAQWEPEKRQWGWSDVITSIGVEPHEFYVWIDHNFEMKDEIRLIKDDGMFTETGGIPINRKLWMELEADPNTDYKDLDTGYLEHISCEAKSKIEAIPVSQMIDAITHLTQR